MDETKGVFGIIDFVVFIGMLVVAAGIGIFYAFKDRKLKSVDNYYFGGRNLSPIPVGISMAVTFISSITVLGYPTHAYLKGTIVMWFSVATLVQVVIGCLYYIPLYHRLQIASVYEYLELRFHKSVRRIASFLIVANSVFYMGLTIYLTSLALNAVTPMDFKVSILVTAGICTFYTTLGGVKAVIWTDTVQAGIMVGGSIAVFIKATIIVGGLDNVWEAVERGERNTIWNFNLDPTEQNTFWSIVVGMGTSWTAASCCNQLITQRYQSCKSVTDARIASLISGLPMAGLLFIALLNGCAMYAYFEGCDPFTNGEIKKMDQSIPYLVVQIFEDTPGMAGLFVAAAYSGMLSTVSSGINAISGLILEDFILIWFPKLKDSTKLTISKILGLLFGILVTAMAYLTGFMGQTVIQMAITVVGLFGGPLLGVYTLGIFMPWTNSIGAFVGLVTGLCFSSWVGVGGMVYAPKPGTLHILSLSTDECPITNATYFATTGSTATSALVTESLLLNATTEVFGSLSERPPIANSLYAISYLYLGMLGLLSTIVVGLLVSFLTGANNPRISDPNLFMPFIDNRFLPESVRKFFRFGVPEIPRKTIPGDDDSVSYRSDTMRKYVDGWEQNDGHVINREAPLLYCEENV